MCTSLGRSLTLAAMLATSLAASGAPAHAQFRIGDRIKKAAEDKLKKRKEQTDSAILARAVQAVDSTVNKTGRGFDTAVAKVGTATDTMLNRSERGVKSLVGRGDADAGKLEATLAADLAADGRVVLADLHFSADGVLDTSAQTTIRALAKVLAAASGSFLIEGHSAPSADAAQATARSEAQAKAVKAVLVAEGVDASRLFVMGLGSSRPPAAGGAAARVEIARMQ